MALREGIYTIIQAYAKVKSKRGKINPNEGFVIQLRKYEKKILESQKDNK